jgi:beta-N-acetylglucosaminidase-like protein
MFRKVNMKMKVYIPALFVLLELGAVAGAEPAGDAWNVVLPVGLDQRVEGQLLELAAQERATVHFFLSFREVPLRAIGPDEILIELRQEKTSFLKALEAEAGSAAIQPTEELAREGYILEAFYPSASLPNNFRITAATAGGFHYALLRLPALLRIPASNVVTGLIPAPQAVRTAQSGSKVILADYPGFAERGVVEGFYGRPWSHQDRLAVLSFEGQHGMNVYYYCPMDDPHNRRLWREPYPAAEMRRMRELVDGARRNFVDFCFALNPGLSMRYSSEEDFATLTSKLASLSKLGISCFSLCLGDIPEALQDPADRARFRTLAAAHVDLINRLYHYLKVLSPNNRLTITPVTYTSAWGSRDYIRELGAGVDPEVELIWSGPDVASPAITLPQAKEWSEFLHRKPLIWDNFPTNDGQGWRLNLGPLRSRDRNLNGAVRGLISNPMNQAVASLIPLETVADYLWNPTAYDPEKSENHALISQYGEDAPHLLGAYLKAYSDYYWDENLFTPLFEERRYAFDVTAMRRAIAALEASLGPLRKQSRFSRLLPELSPFPGQTRERLEQVEADSAFRKLPDGKLQWCDDYDLLTAGQLPQPPRLDGDFGKWQGGPLYPLDRETQADQQDKSRSGVPAFSVRVGLGWDEQYLYIGVEVKDSEIYQPFFGRGIQDGDAFILNLETAFRRDFLAARRNGNLYPLYFSPGNFAGVRPSIFLDDDHLPPHPRPHDCNNEIKTAWKRTPEGFSGDIAIPVSFFEDGSFTKGYEIGLSLGGQKVIRSASTGKEEDLESAVNYYTSKRDRLFPFDGDNPASYQRLVLTDSK